MLGMADKKKPKPRSSSRHSDRNMISVPGDLYARIKASAKRNGRPISWETRRLLGKALDSEETSPPQP